MERIANAEETLEALRDYQKVIQILAWRYGPITITRQEAEIFQNTFNRKNMLQYSQYQDHVVVEIIDRPEEYIGGQGYIYLTEFNETEA